jgi:thioredoxin 1
MNVINEENFEDFVKKNKVAVIDFWAPWCMPCRALAPIMEELEKEMDSVAFGKVNVDENVSLARKFGIMSIPTILIFLNGEEVDRIIGYVSKGEIKERIARYSGNFSP